jgi:phosphatidylglycerophosphate synthase
MLSDNDISNNDILNNDISKNNISTNYSNKKNEEKEIIKDLLMNPNNNKSGRLIENKYDDIIDYYLINIAEISNPYFYKIGFTPNMLTTLSFIFTIAFAVCFYNKEFLFAGFFYLISYFFDCCDGNFARTYKMESEFGDYYDHITDIFECLCFITILYYLSGDICVFFIISLFILLFFLISIFHLKNEKSKNNTCTITESTQCILNFVPHINVNITRFFGTGVFNFINTIIIIFFPYIKNIITNFLVS